MTANLIYVCTIENQLKLKLRTPANVAFVLFSEASEFISGARNAFSRVSENRSSCDIACTTKRFNCLASRGINFNALHPIQMQSIKGEQL